MDEAQYKALFPVFARELGRRGGKVSSKKKGFGSSGKAREAALNRWADKRKSSKQG